MAAETPSRVKQTQAGRGRVLPPFFFAFLFSDILADRRDRAEFCTSFRDPGVGTLGILYFNRGQVLVMITQVV